MCIFSPPKIPTPVLPPEPAAMKIPDGGAVRGERSRRVTDQMRSSAGTILTSGSGVLTPGVSEKKTLLGQ
jgi:hypothetical protein